MNTPSSLPATNDRAAYIYAGTTVLIWSTVATAFKLGLRHLTPLDLVCIAVPVSFCALLLLALFSGRGRLFFAVPTADLLRCALLGCLNPFLYYLILFKAYSLLPAQAAQPINYTWAIMLALLSVPLLKHRLVKGEIPAAIISYLGVVIIALGGNAGAAGAISPLGVALALISTLIWALYWICNSRTRLDPLVALTLNFLFASILLALALPFLSSYGAFRDLLFGTKAAALLPAVYVGLFEMGISFFFWMKAMQLTSSASRISMLIYFAPFLSLIFIRLVLGEAIRPATLAGLACIILGSIHHRRSLRRSKREEADSR